MNLSDSHILVKALSATKSPVTVTDAQQPDNPIVYCNDAFIALTGYVREEIIGKNCRFLQGQSTDQKAVDKLREAIKEAKDIGVILLNYKKNGKPFWNDLQMSPVFNEQGQLTHFIGLQIDVTQRIERERALALARQLESEKKLLFAEKEKLLKLNEVKDDFISIASHQLRTPVTAVKQYLGMLIDGMYGDLTKDQKQALQVAYRNNDRQLNIIDNLLKVAKIDTDRIVVKRRRSNLTNLLTGTLEDFKYRFIEAGADISVQIAAHPIHITMDRHLIRTVFENLIDNAIKYSPDSLVLRVTLEQTEDSVLVKFQDNGIGMSEADIEKIFNKFARSDSVEAKNIGGTGLGLYWAKSVLSLHNASIDVRSKKGHGSEFIITFPRMN